MLRRISILLVSVIFAGLAFFAYRIYVADPMVARELIAEPDGERAQKVMLLGLPSGRLLPVNYLREGEMVYAGSDGRWWQELRGEGAEVTALIRGEKLHGRARAIESDPDYTRRIFERLRPLSHRFLGGVLVEIRLDREGEISASSKPSHR